MSTAGIPPQPFLRRRGTRLALRYLAAVLLTVVFLFPIYWLFMISFKTPDEIFHFPPVWYPRSLQFANYYVLFKDGDAITVWNSLVLAGVSTVIAMMLGTIAAYSLARFRTGGENLAMWIISQRMMPPIAIVFPIFLLYVYLHWIDTYIGLILLYTAFSLPYVIWMMRGYIEDIPIELEESALVDGLTRWQTLWKVVFPMARSGLFATAVFTFIFAWNEFLFALVLTRTEVVTYTVQVTHYFGGQSNFWAKIAAMSVLGTVPVFITVAMLQRYLVRGISMGAVKIAGMADLKITALHKHYGSVHAVRGIDLEIPKGEFTVLVGPSGCGKSTLLRTIAGLEDADAGSIEIGGNIVNHVRPRDRDIAMVFQNYALYPYLSVFENIAFGLRARKTPEAEVRTRVGQAANMLGITSLLERLPRQLSGGQRQRVAIGRAIVRNPRIFLFDEPLSNLDAQLRDEMRGEIKRLHRDIGTTMIYVTHDQIEAMTLADRIVLMRDGLIEQQGSPLELFERPRTRFVAGFLGSPQMNFVPARMAGRDGAATLQLRDDSALAWPAGRRAEATLAAGKELLLGIRPEHIHRAVGAVDPGHARRRLLVELVQPTGSRTFITLSLGGSPIIAEVAAHDAQNTGETIDLDFDLTRAILIDAASGKVLGADAANGSAVKPQTAPTSTRATSIAATTATTEAAMSISEPSRAVKLFGTETEDAKGRTLTAGALTAVLDNGALRYIRLGDSEVMRAIAFLVRDENWGTFTPEITNLKVVESNGTFAVTYDGRCGDSKRSIRYQAQLACSGDGTLLFNVKARPDSDFLTNRTGFVVLHPLAGVAGHPVEVEHVDGRKVRSEFPAIINPLQPFYDIRALTHEVRPGLSVTCRMEGDSFEMEDHRNWTDASFKTYVRPLAKPWPYTLPIGQEFTQSISLTFSGKLPVPAVHVGSRGIGIAVAGPTSARMPHIGLGVPAEEAGPALGVADLVRASRIDTLVCQLDGLRSDIEATTRALAKLANATGAAIVAEIILPAKGHPEDELAPIARAVAAAGLRLAAITVSPAPHLKAVLPGSKGPDVPTFETTYASARAAFPGVTLGGGMYSYFTELNRTRPPVELLDFVTHTTAPIVHAADDVSVMETLEALPYVIQSTRAFIKGKPYRVGPSAIPARDNPYGAATAANPNNGRVCLARMDPRQRGLFGAAWTLGYIAAFAKGGIDVVSIGAPTGSSGIIARKTDYAQPFFDAAPGPAVYPVYHVISGLAESTGAPVHEVRSSQPSAVVALAYAGAGGAVLWLANLTDTEQSVTVTGLASASARVRHLNEATFLEATTRPAFMAEAGASVNTGEPLALAPYAVARVTPSRG